MNGIVQEIPDS